MNFWDTEDGTITKDNTESTFDGGGGGFDPIPEKTVLVSALSGLKWDEYEGDEYISGRWDVVDGQFKNRIVFQKLRVLDEDPKKRDKALRMLAAIDANAGGKLVSVQGKPTDVQLASLCNKPMEIRVMVWEIDGKTGNWVSAVGKLGSLSGSSKPVSENSTRQAFRGALREKIEESFDDDIPF